MERQRRTGSFRLKRHFLMIFETVEIWPHFPLCLAGPCLCLFPLQRGKEEEEKAVSFSFSLSPFLFMQDDTMLRFQEEEKMSEITSPLAARRPLHGNVKGSSRAEKRHCPTVIGDDRRVVACWCV